MPNNNHPIPNTNPDTNNESSEPDTNESSDPRPRVDTVEATDSVEATIEDVTLSLSHSEEQSSEEDIRDQIPDEAIEVPDDDFGWIHVDHEDAHLAGFTEAEEPYSEPFLSIIYAQDVETVIPIRYYELDDSNNLTTLEHQIPSTMFIPRSEDDYREMELVYQIVFGDEDFDHQTRQEALRDLSNLNSNEIEEEILDEVFSALDRQAEDDLDEEMAVEEDSTEPEDDDYIREEVVATADSADEGEILEEHTHPVETPMDRDMDGRYDHTSNELERLREMATDIEARVDYLLQKRQRIVEKMEDLKDE